MGVREGAHRLAGEQGMDEVVPRTARRATSADVAAASGVSRATVSYVLNGTPGHRVSERTRDLVLRTARELGHVPSAAARILRRGSSDIVLAIVRDFSVGYISDRLLTRLDAALAERGHVLLVHRFDETVRGLDDLWGRVDPSIVVTMGGLTDEEVPDDLLGTSPVFRIHGIVRHADAGRMQTQYLHARGHARIGYAVSDHPALPRAAAERLAGAQEAMRELGLEEPLVARIDVDRPESVADAVETWRAAGVTAVCAHNDELGLLILSAMGTLGIASHELAVIGVDDIPAARVALTTVRIDVDAWASAVVDAVLSTIDSGEAPTVEGDFLSLVPRASA